MIEFTNILIRAALPLHPYLAKHPRLSLRLVADDTVCGETPGVNGDLVNGIWAFNSKLIAPAPKQSLTIAVTTGVRGTRIQVVSLTIKVADLLARVMDQENGCQDFDIFDSSAPLQLKLIMTCYINLYPIMGGSSQVVGNGSHTVDKHRKAIQPNVAPQKPELQRREDLKSFYARAIRLPDQDHKAHGLSLLGYTYHALYREERGRADLEKAVFLHEEAMRFTSSFHPQLAEHASRLAIALTERFEQSGNPVDIDRAIFNYQRALGSTRDHDAEKSARLSELGTALGLRFLRVGDLTDIENSISCHRQAVELTADGHADKPRRLCNLGNALQSRFEHLGVLSDINDAISNQQTAAELTPDSHPDKPSRLSNLAGALQNRFWRLGRLADIHDTISNQQQAVKLTPDGHPDKPGQLSNLGGALQRRFERLGSFTDVDDAISNLLKATELTPDSHPDMPSWLSNLGASLQRRFERLGSLADLDDAISKQQKAADLTPDGHPNKPRRLNNLGAALEYRFKRLGSPADVEDAISNQQKAVELTPDGHPEKPSFLSGLGGGYITRFERVCIPSDIEGALSAFSTAAKSTSGPAMVRFTAARRWANVAEALSRSPLDAFSCAIDLLPRIAWLGLAVTDQHALLADVGDIVRDAVAAAIRYEAYETAVVWAERGRSIVWQNLLGLRSAVDDLRRSHPRLADRLQSISRQLEESASHDALRNEDQAVPVEDVSRGYSKLAVEWDNLIGEIRRIPNFEGFLKAKSFKELATVAHEGPVVILNANNSQCDALVLILDDSVGRHVSVVHIPLERFSYEKGKKLFQALTGLLSSAGLRSRNERMTGRTQSQADGEAKFRRILGILWQDVVKPVIEGLAFRTESKRPPRVWWCATGLLVFLPIHAAGLYDTQEIGSKISDYVVSSYTPTLTAILELSEPVVREDFQVLMIAQASAPGASSIPKTEEEIMIVHRITTGAQRVSLTGENATVEQVREGMKKSDWIHLACHGQQNPGDPMESGFLLHGKKLKLSEIVKMSLPRADFAFLSACQTAMGDEKLAEESVHLAAGMFLLGCRGVIATTWSIRDEDGPKITEEVYGRIFKDGKPNRKEAAYALQEAVKRLRESGADCIWWVPFIHIGR